MKSHLLSLVFLLAMLGVTAGFVIAVVDLCQGTWEWSYMIIFISAFLMTGSGITVGYHRYTTHRSFAFTPVGKWLARPIILFMGALAWQGSPGRWSAIHQKHHLHTDEEDDPHSPHCRDGPWYRKLYQFLHAHVLWLFREIPDLKIWARGKPDWLERFMTNWYVLIGPVGGSLIAVAIGGWHGLAWYYAAVFLSWNFTWSVNSVTHLVGYRHFKTGDQSTNLWLLSLLTFGESLHNNHHASQKSARFAHRWWEYLVDIGWWEIWLLRCCGMVHQVYTPQKRAVIDS